MTHSNIHPKAAIAIRAAQNRYKWGRWSSKKFATNRGVSGRLYRIACQLEAMKGV